ncbi:MAG TPA: helix-turn-helix domain-containing protein [Ktedonobacteraceae bacterium]|nr:helix-turn-helix domain-containing protein [Ktedonobacteraceae bacterium]
MTHKFPPNTQLKRAREEHNWTQQQLATKIGTNAVNISRWETGINLPTPYFRVRLCEVLKKNSRDLGLLHKDVEDSSPETYTVQQTTSKRPTSLAATIAKDSMRKAPESCICYGRETELETILQWIFDERCHLITLAGIGGIGKTSLAIMTAERARSQFDCICWYSLHPLQNPPPLATVLQAFLAQISNQPGIIFSEENDSNTALLIQYLQQYRCLLLLDNFESVLQGESHTGAYRSGYEEYAQFVQQVIEARHQSCLFITSRELLGDLSHLERETRRARFLQLQGLSPEAGRKVLQDQGLLGSDDVWTALILRYAGNPLALKLIAPTIQEVFNGDIAAFLRENKSIFGGIHTLLEQQFLRLSQTEQEIMYWLAIDQEQVSLYDLGEDLATTAAKDQLIEALASLRRRSMVERSKSGRFFLQPVIMEHIAKRLVEQIYNDITSEKLQLLSSIALIKAQAPNYLRQSQISRILHPLVEKMCLETGQEASKRKLLSLLSGLRTQPEQKSYYAAGNILNILIQLQAALRDMDFSALPIHQAYLQEATLSGINFAYSDVSTSVFAHVLGGTLCVKFSPDGKLVAMGTTSGEILLCQISTYRPLVRYEGHTDAVRSIDFHPTEMLLVSGSVDQTVRFWDTTTGKCVRILSGHTNAVRSVAFSPDGCIAASGSGDRTVRLWEVKTGDCLSILHDHPYWVECVAFSPGGNTLASCSNGTIKLWDVDTSYYLKTLRGHTDTVRTVAFSTDGTLLASSGKDQTIRLWDACTGQCITTLEGHHGFVRSLAFNADSTLLATGSDDYTIRLWDVRKRNCVKILQEHTNRVWSVAFSPDQQMLVSGSEDQTVRFWDSSTGHCIKTVQGYHQQIWSVAFHPHDMLLASGNDDHTVSIWNIRTGQNIAILHGHTNRIRAVSFSSDARYLASCSEDRTIRMWDISTMQCIKVLVGHTNLVSAIAFGSDGTTLVSSSYDQTLRQWNIDTGQCFAIQHNDHLIGPVAFSDDGNAIASGNEEYLIQLWEVHSGQRSSVLQGHTQNIRAIAFSPDKHYLASSDDQAVRLWDLSRGKCIGIFQDHTHAVRTLAFSPNSLVLASGSQDQTVKLWSVQTGQCLATLQGHASWIWSIGFSHNGMIVASGCHDGTVHLWSMETYQQIKTLRGERPYEGMNITGTTGLTLFQKNALKALGAIEHTRESHTDVPTDEMGHEKKR